MGGKWSRGIFKPRSQQTNFIGFAWRASRVPFLGEFQFLNKLYKTSYQVVNGYAASRNYTPGLRDTYFEVNASQIPEFDWNAYPLP